MSWFGASGSSFRSSRIYVLALLGSVGIGMVLRWRLLSHYLHDRYANSEVLDLVRDCLMVSFALLLIAFLALLLFWYLPRLRRGIQPSRRLIKALGMTAIAQLVVNLVSLNVAIYRLSLDSYGLLIESMLQYVSLNLNFLFWYWFFDHPLRLLSASPDPTKPAIPQGILFPEEMIEDEKYQTSNWLPGPIDYFYFTILSSNCFGPPEGHQLIGSRLKLLQIIHTLMMILVLIVIVARAINTLG